MKPTTTTPRTTREYWTAAEKAYLTEEERYLIDYGNIVAHTVIKARHSKSGLDFLAELDAQQFSDKKRLLAAYRENISSDSRSAHDSHMDAAAAAQAEADSYRERAKALTISAEERADLIAAAQDMERMAARSRYAAENAQGYANDTDKDTNSSTSSDREDIAQEARADKLAHMVQAQLEGLEADEELNAADYRSACAAAGRQVSDIAAAKGHQQSRTWIKEATQEQREKWLAEHPEATKAPRYIPMTAAEIETWATKYAAYMPTITSISKDGKTTAAAMPAKVPFSVRGGESAGYFTIEHKEATKDGKRAAGMYIVAHYRTYAPRRIDAPEGATIAAPTQEEAESIASRANLTERERKAFLMVAEAIDTSRDKVSADAQQVAAAMDKAEREYMQTVAERKAKADTQAKRNRIDKDAAQTVQGIKARAAFDKAFEIVGIDSDTNKRKARSRIYEKLEAAAHSKPTNSRKAAQDAQKVLFIGLDDGQAIARALYQFEDAAHVDADTLQRAIKTVEDVQQAEAEARAMQRKADRESDPIKAYTAQLRADAAADRARQQKNRVKILTTAIYTAAKAHAALNAAAADLAKIDTTAAIKWTRKPYAYNAQIISTPAQREQEAIERRKAEQEAHTRAEEAKAAHKAQMAEAEASAADWFIKPASASASIFEAAERERREVAFEASYSKYEAVEQRRKAAAAAQEAAQAKAQADRRNAYNTALKATLAALNTTWAKATPAQREQATAAAKATAKKA